MSERWFSVTRDLGFKQAYRVNVTRLCRSGEPKTGFVWLDVSGVSSEAHIEMTIEQATALIQDLEKAISTAKSPGNVSIADTLSILQTGKEAN